LLRVEIEELDNKPGPGVESLPLKFDVEGLPGKSIQFRSGRMIYDDNNISNKRIFIIEVPEFPIEDLVGRRIFSRS
jgi:hypothetical protein